MNQSSELAPLVAVHSATTFMMTGMIFLVHGVHYPLFRHVARDEFVVFHAAHARRITYWVGPLMGLELASACGLAILQPCGFWSVCVGLSALCFALTGLVAVPLHSILARGWHAAAHARLMRVNLGRTLVWAVHAIILVGWLARR